MCVYTLEMTKSIIPKRGNVNVADRQISLLALKGGHFTEHPSVNKSVFASEPDFVHTHCVFGGKRSAGLLDRV